MTKVAIACDHGGFEFKTMIMDTFKDGIDWIDLGTHGKDSVNYADYGRAMGRAITEGKAEKGILICGSGIGISIAANRFPAVRAALCTNVTMARLCRRHNDANVLALGGRIIGPAVAVECVNTFFNTEFEGGRHQARVDSLSACL